MMSKTPNSLLPMTPDTMRSFTQEIVVDTSDLLRKAVQKQMITQLPELVNEGKDISYLAAFEALRMFRHITQEQKAQYSEAEKSQLAEVEVDWCLDILDRLQRAGKIDE
jgi:hypothetical protein